MSEKVYIETYGCQMNVADSEIVANVLQKNEFQIIDKAENADVLIINTCSIRDNAEQRVVKRVAELQHLRKSNKKLKIGIIGCMAERISEGLLDAGINVEFLAGPDSYRNIAEIVNSSSEQRVTDIVLSHSENYDDIIPDKMLTQGISAFVPIMRGCENFCTYCVVPYTRGKERSRSPKSIIEEVKNHFKNGIKEITLLGQNVNSYLFKNEEGEINFPKLLDKLAVDFAEIRFRFATSHPKDLSDELIEVIANNSNIARCIHLPMQSGSNAVLKRMNRKYTIEWYLERAEAIKNRIPDCSISTDIIAGFCGETDEDHKQTLDAMSKVGFFYAFMFMYSERTGTAAAKVLNDDVSEEVKSRRLTEIINHQQNLSLEHNKSDVDKIFEVLVEDVSKRNKAEMMGRTSQNKVVIFPADTSVIKAGSYVNVKINSFTSATLKGEIVD